MKNVFFLLLFTLPFMLSAQDDIQLIKPIIESPSMNLNQAKAFSQFQTFNNWGIKKLELDKVMKDYSGKGIKVCICDTGLPLHRDLQSSIKGSKNFSSSSKVDDGNGHSTHVAGIVKEIAPSAELYFAKVLSDSGSGSSASVAEGIKWCADQGSQVINLSLGSSQPSASIKAAIDFAISKGFLIVAAAGNNGQSDTVNKMGYPARYEETLAVGSVNDHLHVSLFSSSGDEGDLVAPGERILSTWKNDEYIVASGTSMATPYISAVAALFLEKHGDVKALEGLFEGSSTDIIPEGFDRYSFHGHVTPVPLFVKDTLDQDDPDQPVDDPAEENNSTALIIGIISVVLLIGLFFFIRIRSKSDQDEEL